jgi:hypothetical protein
MGVDKMINEFIQAAKPRPWYALWWDVWGNPGLSSFQSLLHETDRGSTRGFIWLGVTTIVVTLLSSLIAVLSAGDFRTLISQFSRSFYLSYLCGLLLTPVFSIIGMSIGAFIFHVISKLFGGSGKWDELIFCLSAVVAPYTLFEGVMAVIYLVFFKTPFVVFVPLVVSIVIGVYMLVLYVNAIRAAENLGIGQAIGTLLTPVILLGVCFLITFLWLLPVVRTGN